MFARPSQLMNGRPSIFRRRSVSGPRTRISFRPWSQSTSRCCQAEKRLQCPIGSSRSGRQAVDEVLEFREAHLGILRGRVRGEQGSDPAKLADGMAAHEDARDLSHGALVQGHLGRRDQAQRLRVRRTHDRDEAVVGLDDEAHGREARAAAARPKRADRALPPSRGAPRARTDDRPTSAPTRRPRGSTARRERFPGWRSLAGLNGDGVLDEEVGELPTRSRRGRRHQRTGRVTRGYRVFPRYGWTGQRSRPCAGRGAGGRHWSPDEFRDSCLVRAR